MGGRLMSLNDQEIKSAEARKKDYKLSDEKGLYLSVAKVQSSKFKVQRAKSKEQRAKVLAKCLKIILKKSPVVPVLVNCLGYNYKVTLLSLKFHQPQIEAIG